MRRGIGVVVLKAYGKGWSSEAWGHLRMEAVGVEET